LQGFTGVSGEKGSIGSPGELGVQGQPGVGGRTGQRGETGPDGDTGATGPAGKMYLAHIFRFKFCQKIREFNQISKNSPKICYCIFLLLEIFKICCKNS